MTDQAPTTAASLAAELEADIRTGRLPPGAQLPTHRTLAEARGIAVNTATRAMRLLAARGLVVGEVGRGSFVRAPAQADASAFRNEAKAADVIDLSRNTMPLPGLGERFQATAAAVLRRHRDLYGYQPHAGDDADRAAGAAWLAREGYLPNDPGRIVVCAGAQHAAFLTLMAVTRPGDSVAVEALTWPGIKAAAAALHLTLVPVPIDQDGLRPRALLRLAARHRIKALYCMPSLHNPTSTVLPQNRREIVAALARRLDFQIIESDVYGFLTDRAAPPLASLAPSVPG
ncbi:MAG TPA: PLP-dependent aminotransferase family protein [Rhodopila sp.]|nr:PLP-dependent aminotransferase family protein [Rhodopila sp.]